MAPWIEEKWKYIQADFELSKHIPAAINEEMMFAIIGKKQRYSREDAKRLHKAQYSSDRYQDLLDIKETNQKGETEGIAYSRSRMLEILKDRTRYVIQRGSTLNNPHIPAGYFAQWEEITKNHAIRLRELVKEWLNAKQPQANVPLPAQHDNP